MKTDRKYYGLFYKSHDEWVGPWCQKIFTKDQLSQQLPDIKQFLKSKVDVRKVKFVE
jgi:hypothetical protein